MHVGQMSFGQIASGVLTKYYSAEWHSMYRPNIIWPNACWPNVIQSNGIKGVKQMHVGQMSFGQMVSNVLTKCLSAKWLSTKSRVKVLSHVSCDVSSMLECLVYFISLVDSTLVKILLQLITTITVLCIYHEWKDTMIRIDFVQVKSSVYRVSRVKSSYTCAIRCDAILLKLFYISIHTLNFSSYNQNSGNYFLSVWIVVCLFVCCCCCCCIFSVVQLH